MVFWNGDVHAIQGKGGAELPCLTLSDGTVVELSKEGLTISNATLPWGELIKIKNCQPITKSLEA